MATVPMIAPDGSSGDIPKERAQEAYAAGFKRAVVMHSPDGQQGYVPMERAQEALNAGFKVGQNISELDTPKLGVADTLSGMAGKAGDFLKGVVTSPGQVLGNPMKAAAQTVFNVANANAHTPADASDYERGAMAAGAALNANTPKMANAVKTGDYGQALVEATPLLAQAATPAVVRGVTKGVPFVGKLVGKVPEAVGDVADNLRPSGAQAAVVPEAANLPPKAIQGAEQIFKAAAPTGMNKGFRGNLYAAAGDLAEIGNKVDLAEAKGGIVNPDMRVRATVDAMRDHLNEMYQNERAPQIARNADAPVSVGKGADASRGLEYLEVAGEEQVRNLAKKALDNKTLTLGEADTLAQATNQELKGFEKMTPEGKIQARTVNPKIGGLKALDEEFGKNINQVLGDAGETGLRSYERRFAAVSAMRDALEARMNAAELDQPGILKGVVGRVTKPVAALVTGNKAQIASASQAAVADINIGRTLQDGFKMLKESGIKPNRGVARGVPLPKR